MSKAKHELIALLICSISSNLYYTQNKQKNNPFGFILFDMTTDKRIIGLLVFKSKCNLPDPYPISLNYVSQ